MMNSKTMVLAAIFGVFSLIVSCTEDNEPKNEIPSELIGTWTYVNMARTDCSNSDNNGTEAMSCNDDTCRKITFTADGVITMRITEEGATETMTGTYTISGNQISYDFDDDNGTDRFEVNGNELTITFEEDGCTIHDSYSKD